VRQIVGDINRDIAAFERHFRKFLRGEDRANLQSVLFNVPGRLVAGCWADYENMGQVFRDVFARIKPAEIGRRMKNTAARPGVFHITCLLVSYLIARQQEILLYKTAGRPYSDEARIEEMHLLFDAGCTILQTARNDGMRFPGENQDTMPLLDEAAQQELASRLTPPSPTEITQRRRAWATLTAYNFLFHGELRDGIFNHGPYDLGAGRFLLVKELTDLHNNFFPWVKELCEAPVGLVRALVFKDVRFHFDVLGGVATQPLTADDRIVVDGFFEVSSGQLSPCDDARTNAILETVNENTSVLYEEFSSWDDASKLRYGTLLHANFLRGFWEELPATPELVHRAIEGYSQSGEKHLAELADRKMPLVMEHIATTPDALFSPLLI